MTMNPLPELIPMLKQLRLSGVLDSIESRNRQAIDEKFSYMDFLATIVQDEIARRTQKRLASAIRRANFRNQKTLEEFDFSFNPNINRSLIAELASCRFMEEKVGVLIVGPCGTGKSHIAQALGHCAIRAGYDVLFVTASRLLVQINAARATNTFERQLAKLAGVDLLIIDLC
jgi:DNA replication protein DnaC